MLELSSSLSLWEESMRDEPAEIKTMQDFNVWTFKRWGEKDYLGKFVGEDIEWKKRKEIHELALNVGSFLHSEGLQKGDRVGIYSENSSEVASLIEACQLYGFVSVATFNPGVLTYPRYVLANARLSALYISPGKAVDIEFLKDPEFDQMKIVLSLEPLPKIAHKNVLINEISSVEPVPLPSVDPEDPCTICYSSGTSGSPKGVVLSHRAHLTGILMVGACAPVDESIVHISVLPLSHILERIGLHLIQLRGGRIVFASSGTASLLQDMKRAGATGGPFIPAFLTKFHEIIKSKIDSPFKRNLFRLCIQMAKITRFIGFDSRLADLIMFNQIKTAICPTLEWFVVAGEPLDSIVHEELSLILGIDIITIYGLSECGGPVSSVPKHNIRYGTTGIVMPGVKVRLTETNEILIRSPAMFSSYWMDEEATTNAFNEGWFRTGDRGLVDNAGHLLVPGRNYEIFEFEPGLTLALPFLRYTYRKFHLIDDIFIIPVKELKCLIAIVLPVPNTIELLFQKASTPEQNKKYVMRDDYRDYLLKELNQFALKIKLSQAPPIKAIRITNLPFSIENGGSTPTGKLRTKHLEDLYRKEIEQMITNLKSHK